MEKKKTKLESAIDSKNRAQKAKAKTQAELDAIKTMIREGWRPKD